MFDLGGVAQPSGGNRLGRLNVKADVVASGIRRTKAGQRVVGTTDQLATGFHIIQRASESRAGEDGGRRKRAEEKGIFPSFPLPFPPLF